MVFGVWFVNQIALFLKSVIIYWKVVSPAKTRFQSILFFGGHHIYTTSKTTERDKILDKRTVELLLNIIKITLAITVASISFIVYPIYEHFYRKKHTTILSFELPFTVPESDTGYSLNLINQLLVCYVGFFGNIGIEMLTCIINNNLYAAIDVVQNTIEDMDLILAKGKFNLETSLIFRNVLIRIQDLDR